MTKLLLCHQNQRSVVLYRNYIAEKTASLLINIDEADLGEGRGGEGERAGACPNPNFVSAALSAAAATSQRDVDKISLASPLEKILDSHLHLSKTQRSGSQ